MPCRCATTPPSEGKLGYRDSGLTNSSESRVDRFDVAAPGDVNSIPMTALLEARSIIVPKRRVRCARLLSQRVAAGAYTPRTSALSEM